MAKYYIILVLILGGVLFYIFLEDPCNKILRADFSEQYPSYKILDSGSREGSPSEVQCHIRYQRPDSEQAYEDIWLYKNSGSGWVFSSVLVAQKKEQVP
jgi:hypothetical protein